MKHTVFFFRFSFFISLIYPFGSTAQVFSCIGDYGAASQAEMDVSNLVKSWNPEFIFTTGDNNYFYGDSLTIDTNIGYFYHPYIFPYLGKFSDSTDTTTINRFFPSLGNHDLYTANGLPYFDYFTLPGNERYYDFVWGDVHFFVLNSDSSAGYEPDGVLSNSFQAGWLMGKLSSTVSKWNIVYFHHPPYSSCEIHGSSSWMQWPFEQWGATAILSGHDHVYERLKVGNIPYFVNGLGGRMGIYNFGTLLPESEKQYNGNYGAMRISAFPDSIIFEFINIEDSLVDKLVIADFVVGKKNIVPDSFQSSVFPNPFLTKMNITFARELVSGKLIIYDLLGREIEREENIAGNMFTVSAERFLPGLFFYLVTENGQVLSTGRIMKQDP